MESLSEYELQRLEHMRRNHEELVRLGLADPEPDPSEAPKPKAKRKRAPPPPPPRPARAQTCLAPALSLARRHAAARSTATRTPASPGGGGGSPPCGVPTEASALSSTLSRSVSIGSAFSFLGTRLPAKWIHICVFSPDLVKKFMQSSVRIATRRLSAVVASTSSFHGPWSQSRPGCPGRSYRPPQHVPYHQRARMWPAHSVPLKNMMPVWLGRALPSRVGYGWFHSVAACARAGLASGLRASLWRSASAAAKNEGTDASKRLKMASESR